MGKKIEYTDTYTFGRQMFNGAIPLIKNGSMCACTRNIDMIEPSEIQTLQGDNVGGKIIKAPCHKQCVALKKAKLKDVEQNTEVSGFVLGCLDNMFIKVEDLGNERLVV